MELGLLVWYILVILLMIIGDSDAGYGNRLDTRRFWSGYGLSVQRPKPGQAQAPPPPPPPSPPPGRTKAQSVVLHGMPTHHKVERM